MTTMVPYTSPAPAPGRFAAEWLTDPAEIARVVGATDFVPAGLRGNAAAITAALLYGSEVGLQPMQSLANIAVINGRPTLSAEAQRALILHAGHEVWFEETTITRCTVCGRRRDSAETTRITWTMDDAKRANLAGRQNWRLFPAEMLRARASAALARAIFPDAIGGLAATEELDDFAGEDIVAPVEPPQPTTPTRRRRRTGIATAPPAPTPAPPPTPEPPPVPGDEAVPPTPQTGEDQGQETLPQPAEPEPLPVPGDEGPELIGEDQMKRLQAAFRDAGFDDRQHRMAFTRFHIGGRMIESSKELTADEASKLISLLEGQSAT